MPSLMRPGASLKRLKRFQQVVNVLAKYGFGRALSRVHVWECDNIERRVLRRACQLPGLTAPQRLRLAIEELGPTFIKLGQVLSTRPDLVPPDIIVELKKLQAGASFVPSDVIRSIVESELGRPITEVFDSFDDKPLAAASLAQVHRAVLKGEQVVLKVQRPDIVETTEVDIDILRRLASVAERYSPTVYLINPTGMVEEFAEQLKKELDFRMEVTNMLRFAHNFASDRTVRIPAPYPELCTRRVITMQFLDGINISETKRLADEGYDLPLIVRRGANIGFKATFEHGFFHADTHPGNIFVLPGNNIGLVDFGMMATLPQRDRERLARLVYFISRRDERRVARALNELMESEDVVLAEQLEPSMSAVIGEYADVPARELRLAAMLFALMRAIMMQGGRFRPQLIWLAKSIAIHEDVGHALNADFNMMELGRPFARKVLSQRFNPLRHRQEMFFWLGDALDMARDLPYDAAIIMRQFRRGRFKIEFEHVGLEPIRQTISQVANRLALTIIIAALLISSSVIMLARLPPFVGEMPVLGFIGYVIAAVLGIILAKAMLFRSR